MKPHRIPPFGALPLLWPLLAASGALMAEQDPRWALCPVPAAIQEVDEALAPGLTRVLADQAEVDAEGVSHFGGGVEVRRDDKHLSANEARYDHRSDELEVWGEVDYRDPRMQVQGERATMRLQSGLGQWENGEFFLPQVNAYIHAGRFEMLEDREHSRLDDVRYTTCPPNGRRAWELSASELYLNREENLGEAYHAVLRLGGVPVFYTPYINYPLEGRKSGLLSPTYGSSERNGHDFALPYYWNIAPHRDATFTPRVISERGGQLQAEYRYREDWGDGALNGEWLPSDQLYGDKERGYLQLDHRARLSGWQLSLGYRETSDAEYFNDIDSPLVNRSQVYLQRNASARYQGEGWRFGTRVQDFQPLGTNTTPYRLAPQLRFEGASAYRPNYPRLELHAELARFQHESKTPTGSRSDIKPTLSWPLSGDAWFLTPAVAWRHTAYRLNDPALGQVTDPRRSLPITSLDGGLFFERDYRLGERNLRHTLEPRLYYLQVPHRDQDALPRFDSAPLAFSFPQLFRDNRFSGADRQGDARQLTVALSSRIQDNASGAELARLSLGQIQYLDRPLVTLTPTATPEQRAHSDWVGELTAQPLAGLELSAGGRWNPDLGHSEESSARIALSLDEERSISYGHRHHRERAEKHHDLLLLWPLSQRWHGVGRWYYDVEAARTVESLLGLEYRSCCWNLRVVGRSKPYFDANSQGWEPDHSLYVTLELKGLGTAGRKLNDVIREGILGYY